MARIRAVGAVIRLGDQARLRSLAQREARAVADGGTDGDQAVSRRILTAHEAGQLFVVEAALYADVEREHGTERVNGAVSEDLLMETDRSEYDERYLREIVSDHLDDLTQRLGRAGIDVSEDDLHRKGVSIELDPEVARRLDDPEPSTG